MSVMKRLKLIFSAKANKALDRAEDPRETLDYSYERQLEMLQKVRRGVADVATSRKRLELQMQQLEQQSTKLEGQGRQALGAGREDLAREALTRRSGVQQQQADLSTQHAALQAEEEKLTLASQRLQAKVDAFRTRKETLKATYTAAEAQTKIGEAFSGISEEMGDVGLAVQRAEDKTQAMQARAGAIDELLASGALDDASGTAKDDITAELERMSSQGEVELELARLKGELGAGKAPEAIEGAGPQPGAEAPAPRQPAPRHSGSRGSGHDRPGAGRGSVRRRRRRTPTCSTGWTVAWNGPSSPATRRPSGPRWPSCSRQVRTVGERLPDDSLEPSDAVLPDESSSLEEVRAMLSDSAEGLIPG